MDHDTRRLVGRRYELLDQIGAGGCGHAFRAHDRVLDRTVAVKMLRPGHDDIARARLRAEARIAAGLSHPGIARVLDFGEESVAGETVPYLVMEYVPGTTLREALRGGPMPPRQVAAILAQAADALAAAHAAGIVHRDVKPGNIMLTPEGMAVLLDFGIAQQAHGEPLTATGMIVGTVDYLSPEQAEGRRATPRSDLYSLGVLAYEALTGQRPLTRDTQVATLLAHATAEMPPLPPHVPAPLRSLIEQLVRRDPAERPADAATVAAIAAAAAEGREVLGPPTAQDRRGWWRGGRMITAAAAAAVGVMALGGVLAANGDNDGGPAAAATLTRAAAHQQARTTSGGTTATHSATHRPAAARTTAATQPSAATPVVHQTARRVAVHHRAPAPKPRPKPAPAHRPPHGKDHGPGPGGHGPHPHH